MKVSNPNTEKKILNLLCRYSESIDMSLTYGLEVDDFSSGINQELFEYIVDGYVNSNFVPMDDLEDFIQIIQYDDENDKKETIVYLNKILKLKVKVAGMVTDVNIKMLPRYIDELKSLTIVRKIITGVNRVQGILMDTDSSHLELIQTVEDNLGSLFDKGNNVVRKSMKEAVRDTVQEIVDESEGRSGIRLGLNSDIDDNAKVMSGYLTYVAGAPGIGKSTALLNMVNNIAMDGHRALYITQEMNVNDNIKRIISFRQGIKSHKIQNPKLLDVDDWTKLDDVISKEIFDELGIYWLMQDGMTANDLRNEISKYVRLFDIDVVMIDYYQLIKWTTEYEMSEGIEIPRVSAALREMSKQYYINPAGQSKQIAIVALSQVVKDVERREDKRPTMNDLYYGGAKDARLVLALYRDEYYYPDETDKPNILEVGIVKQNNGIMNVWGNSYFDTSNQKIRDLTSEEQDLLFVESDEDDDEEYEYEDDEE